MNVPATALTVGLASLAIGLSGCASDNGASASSSTSRTTTASASAVASTTTVTSTATVTPASATTTATSASTTQSSPAPTSTSATSSSPMVGGMTECTKAALAEPATQAAQALGADNVYTLDDVTCADGWAVTSGLLASTANPQMGAPRSFVFEQEGQFWVPKDKAAVCGTNPVTTTPPADAKIPVALFVAGCAAG